jgi:membrane protein
MKAHNAFEAAAAIAFWFFLSLVPLLVLVGFFVGHVARTRGVDALVGPLLDVVPAAADAVVHREVERLAGGPVVSLAPVGVAGYLWTASSGLHNLMDVLETAAQARRRPWWKQRAIALGWVILGLATTCIVAWLLVRMESVVSEHSHQSVARLQGALRRRTPKAWNTPGEQIVAAAVMLVVGMAFLAGFYRFAIEHSPRVRRSIWPGTVSAVASWLGVSWVFGAYVVSIADYALYYGSLAAVAVLLVWLYLTSLSLVVGAEVNAQLEHRSRRTSKNARERTRSDQL